MRPKRPVRPPPPPPPPPAVVTPEDLDAINPPEVDKLPAYISPGKFQWKPLLPGPKGDPGEPGEKGDPGAPGEIVRPIVPPVTTIEIGVGQVTPVQLSFVPATRPLVPGIFPAEIEAIDEPADGEVPTCKVVDTVKTFEWKAPAAPPTPVGLFVPRRAISYDFDANAFVPKDDWVVNGLNLAWIVPQGAIAVALQIVGMSSTPGDEFTIVTDLEEAGENMAVMVCQVAEIQRRMFWVLPIDPDRLMDFFCPTSFGMIFVTVVGWYI